MTHLNSIPWFPHLRIDQPSLCIQSCQFDGHSVRDQIPLFCWFRAERFESLWSVWHSKRSHIWYNSFGIHYCPDRMVASKFAKVLVQCLRTRQFDINVPESWSFSLSTSSRNRTWTRFHLYLVEHTCRMITANILAVAVYVDSRAKTVVRFWSSFTLFTPWLGCHEPQKSNWLGIQRHFTHLLVVLVKRIARQKGVRRLGYPLGYISIGYISIGFQVTDWPNWL